MPGSETRTDPGENSLHTKGVFRADHETTFFLRLICDAYEAARSKPSNCDGGLADRVPKWQPDLATRMMCWNKLRFRQIGDFEQSPSSCRSVCDLYILKITKHSVYEILIILHMTVFGRLLTKDVTVAVTTAHGDKVLKQR